MPPLGCFTRSRRLLARASPRAATSTSAAVHARTRARSLPSLRRAGVAAHAQEHAPLAHAHAPPSFLPSLRSRRRAAGVAARAQEHASLLGSSALQHAHGTFLVRDICPTLPGLLSPPVRGTLRHASTHACARARTTGDGRRDVRSAGMAGLETLGLVHEHEFVIKLRAKSAEFSNLRYT